MCISYEVFIIKDQGSTKNNVYLIVDKETKHTAIVDPACNMEQLNNAIKQFGLLLKVVLITHSHQDHIRSVNSIVNSYECKVFISKREAEYYFYQCRNLYMFEDDYEILVGKTKIKCLITPGHSFGSTCYLLYNSIFTGDTVFIEGCGMCDTNGGSAISMFNSIVKIKELVSDKVLVYPGHTYENLPGKPLAYLKHNNIYFLFEKQEDFVKFRMRKNQKRLFDFK